MQNLRVDRQVASFECRLACLSVVLLVSASSWRSLGWSTMRRIRCVSSALCECDKRMLVFAAAAAAAAANEWPKAALSALSEGGG